jgi:hypothetical protein
LQGIACMTTGLSERWQPKMKEDIFLPSANTQLEKRFAQWQEAMKHWLNTAAK